MPSEEGFLEYWGLVRYFPLSFGGKPNNLNLIYFILCECSSPCYDYRTNTHINTTNWKRLETPSFRTRPANRQPWFSELERLAFSSSPLSLFPLSLSRSLSLSLSLSLSNSSLLTQNVFRSRKVFALHPLMNRLIGLPERTRPSEGITSQKRWRTHRTLPKVLNPRLSMKWSV